MYLYRDCGTLPIWNFNQINLKNDFRWLVVGWNGYEDIKVPKDANEVWQDIKNEWVKLLDDNTIAYYYELILELTYLQTRAGLVQQYLYQIATRDMDKETMDKYIELLKGWRFKWNVKNSKKVELERMMNQLKATQNTINLKLDELEQMKKENNFDEAPSSLEKQAVILEQITGKNNIDVMTTSVAKWIEISKLATRINEQRRRNG